MTSRLLRLGCFAYLFIFFATAQAAETLKPLFNGKTFSGWEQRGEAIWEIKDGVIHGRTGKGGHGWLCTEKTYGDFALELEVKIEAGNSGIQIRSHIGTNDVMVGYQIEVDPSPRAWSGGLYEQGRRGWLQNLTNNPAARSAFKVGEWNKYRIVCHGDSIKTWVNGVPATDYIDAMDHEGTIALQVHAGKDARVQFRNIRLAGSGKYKSINNKVEISELDNKLRVELNGKLFTEYYFKDVPRPFCYPLIGPKDLPMTRDWPMKETENEEHDHPHHRSLWFTHGNVNGIDFWSEQKEFGKIVHQKFSQIKSGKAFGLIESENNWVAPNGKTICSDQRRLKIYNSTNPQMFDFEITLKATHGELTFGDTKEGSMAIRVAETMRLKPNPFSNGKTTGHIVQSTGVRDAETWGKRAEWCDYSGPVNGKVQGIAIFDHPTNPRHPTWWHVRDYGLFAANPFGVHDFEQKPPGSGNFTIPAGQSATFRYRFVLHDGDDKAAKIADLYKAFAAEK